jgi:hypothetical protein
VATCRTTTASRPSLSSWHPRRFLGDLSAFIGGTFSFDGNLLGAGGSFFDGPNGIPPAAVFLDYGIIQLIGPTLDSAGRSTACGATAPSGAWQTYSIGLNATAWGMTSANFNTLMQNVTSIRINDRRPLGRRVPRNRQHQSCVS